MKIKLRKLKYKSLIDKISYFIVGLVCIINSIVFVVDLSNYTIGLAEILFVIMYLVLIILLILLMIWKIRS